MQKINQIISTFLVCFFTFSIVFADDLMISQYPDNPREGEEVKLTITSDKYNLDQATITWTIDGNQYDQGIGRKTLNITAPTNGNSEIIVARVEQAGYNSAEIQKVLEANTNFILYEGSDSYVPPFYKGRRLPAKEGIVRAAFFSFKDGEIVGFQDKNGAQYIWNINGEDNNQLSGTNKIVNNIFTRVTDNILNVKVTRTDSTVNIKTSETTIPLQKVDILLYKTDDKLLTKNILNDTELGKSITLLAEPFFFSIPDKRSTDLKYTWKVNDIETKIPVPWAAMFSGKDADSVKINLNVVNNKKITQDADRGFTFKVQ